jgi:transcriptional regulator with XRE-family HTH domain
MTLGQKLSAYRKMAGMTQQQLGEQLNISAQAVSKWENDQAEPDLTTVRALADIYKVSVDTLLSPDSIPSVPVEEIAPVQGNEKVEKTQIVMPVGYCKTCGIAVTEDNLGAKSPVILCKNCLQAEKAAEEKATQKKKLEKEREAFLKKERLASNQRWIRRRFIWSTIVASLVAGLFLFFCIVGLIESFDLGFLAFSLVGTYMIFSFISCLFYDCFVQELVFDWCSKSFQAPGLIFTFDLDGCLWLIGMKILFWAIGLVFGIVAGAIGIAIGLVCAPFAFPFVMHKLKKDYNEGVTEMLM